MAHKAMLQSTAESAIPSIGLGYDIAHDIRLKYCKQRNSPDPLLIELDHDKIQDIVLPGGLTVAGVPEKIIQFKHHVKCDKGKRMQFRFDVLSFQQMSEQFNQELSLSGKIPSGLFNAMFDFTGYWQKDAANTKSLAFDVESDDSSIVTGAQLEVVNHGLKKILFLRLHFSKVCNATSVRNPEWEGSPNLAQKSGLISTLISTHFSTAAQKPAPRPADVNINSAVQIPKLLKFVDTTEMMRGPQDLPGYWVVSGAKLQLERGKISLRVKYSLLTATLPDDDEFALDEQF
ncbi:hypothetical protein E2562_022298 [Oryza meyeriana var. granulata]|uniref:MACPF domain-containing protein n=1 Tax=Oryza meyeriana var. granulata TaxID=110450 RepID=A0A6G1D690_9ORYZ|nr:hypothetical protein E2562_022298 [Oryza meyeriana var. granulata]